MEGFLAHEALEGMVTLRHLELRYKAEEGIRRLRVVPSDGPRTHGLSCTLSIADELWAWSERADLLTAMQTGLVKRPDSKLLMITTSSGELDSPLGRLRQRAMAQKDVRRAGPVVESKSRDLHWLEWSLGEQHELHDVTKLLECAQTQPNHLSPRGKAYIRAGGTQPNRVARPSEKIAHARGPPCASGAPAPAHRRLSSPRVSPGCGSRPRTGVKQSRL